MRPETDPISYLNITDTTHADFRPHLLSEVPGDRTLVSPNPATGVSFTERGVRLNLHAPSAGSALESH